MKRTLLGPRVAFSLVEWCLLIVLLAIVAITAWQTLGTPARADATLTVTKATVAPADADADLSGAIDTEAATEPAVITFTQSGDLLTVRATSPYSPDAALAITMTAEPAAVALPESDLIEISAASPLGPDASVTFSGGIGIRLFAFPDKWPFVGGKSAFASALTVGKYVALGGDVALQKPAEDSTGLRLGACYWRAGGDDEWSIYLRWKAAGF